MTEPRGRSAYKPSKGLGLYFSPEEDLSDADIVSMLPPDEQAKILDNLDENRLQYNDNFWCRKSQLAFINSKTPLTVALAGRGWGKTFALAKAMHRYAMDHPGSRLGLVGRTAADVRDVIILGDSGIMNVVPEEERPEFIPNTRRLVWPNGSHALSFCAAADTEVLTKDKGWITYSNLREGDMIYTLDPKTKMGNWTAVRKVNRFEVYNEPMLECTGESHSSLTTLNHRWPLRSRNNTSDLIWRTSHQIAMTTGDGPDGQRPLSKLRIKTPPYRMFVSAQCQDLPTVAKYSDSLAEIMGWFTTEGHVPTKQLSSRLSLINQSGWEEWLTPKINSYRGHSPDGLPRILKPTRWKNQGAKTIESLKGLCEDIGADFNEALSFYKHMEKRRHISICQYLSVNPDHHARIYTALTTLFGPPRNSLGKTGGSNIKLTKPSWRVVGDTFHLDPIAANVLLEHIDEEKYGHRDKVIRREFLSNLTRAQLQLFLDACIDGDGHRRGNGWTIVQKSKPCLESIAYAAVLLGLPIQHCNVLAKYKGLPYHSYSITKQAKPHLSFTQRKIVSYSGIVWCPTTDTGTWLARREGKIYFTGNSAERPDGIRGTQQHAAFVDEAAAFRQNKATGLINAFDQIRISCRLGENPQIWVATTPKRNEIVLDIVRQAEERPETVTLIRGSTTANRHLSQSYQATMMGLYAGTTLGAQEISGEILTDVDGALLYQSTIDLHRTEEFSHTLCPDFWRTLPLRVVGVDPSISSNPNDECGIIVAGSTGEKKLEQRHAYILEDASVQGSPDEWATRVVEMARKYQAVVIAESNQGGELVRLVIKGKDPKVPVLLVHAKVGKFERAEPVAAAYQRGRVHHTDVFEMLESQWTGWAPGQGLASPDRLDSCVAGGTLITMGDGTEKPIQEINPGERVMTRNGPKRVLRVEKTNNSAKVVQAEAHSTGRTLVATPNHPIWSVDTNNFVRLDAMNWGKILVWNPECMRTTTSTISIYPNVQLKTPGKKEIGYAEVWNMEVEDTHEYFANGVLTHNCTWALQSLLVQEPKGFFGRLEITSDNNTRRIDNTVLDHRPFNPLAVVGEHGVNNPEAIRERLRIMTDIPESDLYPQPDPDEKSLRFPNRPTRIAVPTSDAWSERANRLYGPPSRFRW